MRSEDYNNEKIKKHKSFLGSVVKTFIKYTTISETRRNQTKI